MTGCIAKTQQDKLRSSPYNALWANQHAGKRRLSQLLMPSQALAPCRTLSWTLGDLTQTLDISAPDAGRVLTILKLQGYASETSDNELLTTASGEIVSGSRPPRFTRERVDGAVSELLDRIAANNSDRNAEFKITQAVAFGDFLSGRANCQAADVGIELTPREPAGGRDQVNDFLKQLRGKSQFLNIKPFAPWMSKRSHRRLL